MVLIFCGRASRRNASVPCPAGRHGTSRHPGAPPGPRGCRQLGGSGVFRPRPSPVLATLRGDRPARPLREREAVSGRCAVPCPRCPAAGRPPSFPAFPAKGPCHLDRHASVLIFGSREPPGGRRRPLEIRRSLGYEKRLSRLASHSPCRVMRALCRIIIQRTAVPPWSRVVSGSSRGAAEKRDFSL